MHRLICIFIVRIWHKTHFLMARLIYISHLIKWTILGFWCLWNCDITASVLTLVHNSHWCIITFLFGIHFCYLYFPKNYLKNKQTKKTTTTYTNEAKKSVSIVIRQNPHCCNIWYGHSSIWSVRCATIQYFQSKIVGLHNLGVRIIGNGHGNGGRVTGIGGVKRGEMTATVEIPILIVHLQL